MKKNILDAKNEMVDVEINPGIENSISKNVYGLHRGKNDLYKPPNRESLFPSTVQYKKIFPSHGKMKELQKNVKQTPQLAPVA